MFGPIFCILRIAAIYINIFDPIFSILCIAATYINMFDPILTLSFAYCGLLLDVWISIKIARACYLELQLSFVICNAKVIFLQQYLD